MIFDKFTFKKTNGETTTLSTSPLSPSTPSNIHVNQSDLSHQMSTKLAQWRHFTQTLTTAWATSKQAVHIETPSPTTNHPLSLALAYMETCPPMTALLGEAQDHLPVLAHFHPQHIHHLLLSHP